MADCTLQMASDLSNEKLVGKLVEPDQGCPGYVKSYNRSKDVFVVRYYRKGHEKKRARKLAKDLSREDLMAILLFTRPNADEDDEELGTDAIVDITSDDGEDEEESGTDLD